MLAVLSLTDVWLVAPIRGVWLSLSGILHLPPCCQHPPESRAAPTPTSFTLGIDGDSNKARSLAKQAGVLSFQRSAHI